MSGYNFSNESKGTRPILGDVTNLPVKRGFSSVLDDGFVKAKEIQIGNSALAKKACLQPDNFVKEMSCKGKSEVDGSEKNAPMLKNKQSCTALPSSGSQSVATVVPSMEEKCNSMSDLCVNVAHSFVEPSDALRDSCLSSVLLPLCSKKACDGERVGSDATEDENGDDELYGNQVSNDQDVGLGTLASNKLGSFERSRLHMLQGSRPFELERCTGLKDDGCVNLNAGADLPKNCSCSFCLKAAYIWADLHYQDIKGRIAALKKSQKDASFLVQNWGRAKKPDVPGHGSSNRSSKLEYDLVGQWKSLFLHMEDMFGNESSQLQAGYVSLKDLRENCKMDLERTTGMPSDSH